MPGYEGIYEVSDAGRVRSIDRWMPHPRAREGVALYKGKLLSAKPHKSERYITVVLTKGNGELTSYRVHTLVMLAFKGPCPVGKLVLHKNDTGHDNRLRNLRYGTFKQNMQDCIENGNMQHGVNHYLAVLDDAKVRKIKKLIAKGLSNKDLAEQFGVSPTTINPIRNGATWKHVVI